MVSFLSLLSEGPIGNVICLHMTEESLCNLGIVNKLGYSVIGKYLKFCFNERYDFDTFNEIKGDDFSFWASMLTNFSIAKGNLVEALFLMDDSDIDVFKVCIDECLARGMKIDEIRREKKPRSKNIARREKFGGKYDNYYPGTSKLERHLMFTNRVIKNDYIREKLCDIDQDEIIRRLFISSSLFCDEIVSSFVPFIIKEDLIKPKDGKEAFYDHYRRFDVTNFRKLPLTLSKLAPLLSPRLVHDFISFFMMTFNHRFIEIMEKYAMLSDEEKKRISQFHSNIESVSKCEWFLVKTTKGRYRKIRHIVMRGLN